MPWTVTSTRGTPAAYAPVAPGFRFRSWLMFALQMMMKTFSYSTHEAIEVGDRVISDDRRYGVVTKIIHPRTNDAVAYAIPNGGVEVAEHCDGLTGFVVHPAPDETSVMTDWKLRFIRRGPPISFSYGGTPRWPCEPGPYNGGLRVRNGPLTNEEVGN